MYIENWESFYQQAVDLYQRNPLKARFVTKYRHCDGRLTLKVTDDATVSAAGRAGRRAMRGKHALALWGSRGMRAGLQHGPWATHLTCHSPPALPPCACVQCLQFRTDQAADLRKVEKLNRALFALMATGAAPPAEDVEMQAAEEQQRQKKVTRKG